MKNLALSITIGAAFKGISAFGAAIKNVNSLSKKLDTLNNERIELDKKFGEGNRAARALNSTIEKLSRNLKGMSFTLNISRKMNNFRQEFRSNFLDKVAVATTIAAPFKVAIDFESEMARVKALSGASGEEFKKLQEVAKKLGSTTVFSASEAAKGMQFLAMAGFKTNQIVKAMPGLLNLAAAGAVDLATTADITSNILSGFGISADKTSHVADVLAKAMSSANVDVRMLGETMKYVAPAASSLGASLEEVTTLAAKLGDVGIQGSEAGTALRSMYARLASPPSEAKKTIQMLGLQIKDANGNFIGMFKVLEQLQQKTKHLSDTQKATILKNLFGMEAMSAASALLNQPIEKLREYEKALINADGTAKKIAKTQTDTVAGSFKALVSALEGVSIAFSSLFLPFIKKTTETITAFTQKLNSFIENHKTLASVIGGVVGGFVAFSLILSGVGYIASFVVSGIMKFFRGMIVLNNAFHLLKANILASNTALRIFGFLNSSIVPKLIAFKNAIIKTTMAQKMLNFVMNLNPFAKFMLFASLVIGGLKYLYNKFEWFRDGVNALWGFIKEIFKYSPLGLIINNWSAITNFFSSLWENVKSFFSSAWDNVKSILQNGWDFVKKVFSYSPIGLIVNNWDKIKAFFGNLWDGIKAIFANGIETIKSLFISPISFIANVWNNILGFFNNFWGNLKTGFAKGIEFIANVFISPITFIKKGWDNILGWISSKIEWIASVTGKIKSFFGFGDDKKELNISKEEKKELTIPKFKLPQINIPKTQIPTTIQPISVKEAINNPQIINQSTNNHYIQQPQITNNQYTNTPIHQSNNYTININITGANTNEIIDKIKVILPHLIEEIEENRRERALSDVM